MTPLTTVLFDLDGTLIDSVRLILDSYHHTMAAHGLPERTDDEWLAGLGTPLRVSPGPTIASPWTRWSPLIASITLGTTTCG